MEQLQKILKELVDKKLRIEDKISYEKTLKNNFLRKEE